MWRKLPLQELLKPAGAEQEPTQPDTVSPLLALQQRRIFLALLQGEQTWGLLQAKHSYNPSREEPPLLLLCLHQLPPAPHAHVTSRAPTQPPHPRPPFQVSLSSRGWG